MKHALATMRRGSSAECSDRSRCIGPGRSGVYEALALQSAPPGHTPTERLRQQGDGGSASEATDPSRFILSSALEDGAPNPEEKRSRRTPASLSKSSRPRTGSDPGFGSSDPCDYAALHCTLLALAGLRHRHPGCKADLEQATGAAIAGACSGVLHRQNPSPVKPGRGSRAHLAPTGGTPVSEALRCRSASLQGDTSQESRPPEGVHPGHRAATLSGCPSAARCGRLLHRSCSATAA